MKVIGAALIVLLLIAVGIFAYVARNTNSIVKNAIESIGSQYLGAPVRVGAVDISLQDGRGTLKKLEIGNPPGYAGPYALRAGEVSMTVDVANSNTSLIVLKAVVVDHAQIMAVAKSPHNPIHQQRRLPPSLPAGAPLGRGRSVSVFQTGRQRCRQHDGKGSIMPASDTHDDATNDGPGLPPKFNRVLVLLQHLGVKVVEHRNGSFTGIFEDCHILGPSCRASVEKTTLLKLLRHFWKLDPRRLVDANGELKHFDNIPEDGPERDEAEFRAWLKEQQAAYDQTVGQKPAAPVECEPEPVSPASRRRLHTICELFPAMEGAPFDELVASIKENGLQEPIVLLDDAILDGRNRYNACLAAGVDPLFVLFRGDDPVRFVLAANIHRRHLNDSQRAMLAAQLATLPVGANQHAKKEDASIEAPSQSEAAEMLNVSRSSVQRACRVFEHGAPEDVKAIRDGKATVSGVAEKLKPRRPH